MPPAEGALPAPARLLSAFTVTTNVAVAVSKAVKSAGVNKTVTVAVPAANAVALSVLVILKIAGLLDVKVNCPGTEGVTVGGVRTKVPEPTVFAGMQKHSP